MSRTQQPSANIAPDRAQALGRAAEWAQTNTFQADRLSAEQIVEAKRDLGQRVTVIIPAREVASTVGGVVEACDALRRQGVLDELLVVDADSSDGTAEVAERAGALVLQENELLASFGAVQGKGDAMWRAVSAATGDLVVFVDADTAGFDGRFVTGLIAPLLLDPELQLTKAALRRPFTDGELRVEDGGGRVNELVARPLLNLYLPELAAVNQPLAGEFAARRETLVGLPFRTGYGVEIRLLIDVYRRFGLPAIAQVELGERLNSHQPLRDLAPMAYAVARSLLEAVGGEADGARDLSPFLGYREGRVELRDVELLDRPPLGELQGVVDGA